MSDFLPPDPNIGEWPFLAEVALSGSGGVTMVDGRTLSKLEMISNRGGRGAGLDGLIGCLWSRARASYPL